MEYRRASEKPERDIPPSDGSSENDYDEASARGEHAAKLPTRVEYAPQSSIRRLAIASVHRASG